MTLHTSDNPARRLASLGLQHDTIILHCNDNNRATHLLWTQAWNVILHGYASAVRERNKHLLEAYPEQSVHPLITTDSKAVIARVLDPANEHPLLATALQFFRYLDAALKSPAIIEHAERHAASGHQVVLQIESTSYQAIGRHASHNQFTNSFQLPSDFDLSSADHLINTALDLFPVHFAQPNPGKPGHLRTICNHDAIPLSNPAAKHLLASTQTLLPDDTAPVPLHEQILLHFGHRVANASRQLWNIRRDGTRCLATQSSPEERHAEIRRFQHGEYPILVLDDSVWDTPRLHHHPDYPAALPRTHIIAQNWPMNTLLRFDKASGSTRHATQASEPHLVLVDTDPRRLMPLERDLYT